MLVFVFFSKSMVRVQCRRKFGALTKIDFWLGLWGPLFIAFPEFPIQTFSLTIGDSPVIAVRRVPLRGKSGVKSFPIAGTCCLGALPPTRRAFSQRGAIRAESLGEEDAFICRMGDARAPASNHYRCGSHDLIKNKYSPPFSECPPKLVAQTRTSLTFPSRLVTTAIR